FYRGIWRSVRDTGSWQGEIQSKRKNGELYSEWLSISQLHENGHIYYLAVFSDITHRKDYERTLYALANYDTLTGLPNRNLFSEILEKEVAEAGRKNEKVGLLIIDVDRFKSVVMTLGHTTADELLIDIVHRIRTCLRRHDVLARLGGDEFAVILPGLTESREASSIAREILAAMSHVFTSRNYERYVTLSIGIAVYPETGIDAKFLHKNADTAAYKAKTGGRNQFRMFGFDMHTATLEQLLLEDSLRAALARKEFKLYYQPIVNTNSGKLTRVEALLRWDHPDLGIIAPDYFIHLAEETGLIFQIGEWVIREACSQFRAWNKGGILMPNVSVNVSAVQLRKMNLFSIVAGAIRENSMKPFELDLEITESFAMQNMELSLGFLEDLGGLGVGLSIDDFGSGYSSLAYLKRLPIQRLKIDRSFIKDMPDDRDSNAIADAIVAMAHSLELGVIAEGVESARQMEYLKGIHCDELQGFYFARLRRRTKLSSQNFPDRSERLWPLHLDPLRPTLN
ncbi:MAG TPA: EAL domain-containing protein, partial [Leptospiraceae bacterium]|nr:EAL domain-containing protein [Leptospiraceae bacterium]